MNRGIFKSLLAGTACAAFLAASAHAQNFNIPGGDLKSALESYMKQSGIALMYPEDEVSGIHTKGVTGALSSDEALSRLLKGTGLTTQRGPSGAIGIVQGATQSNLVEPLQLAQAAPPTRASVETVTVTSSKLGGADVQSIPIAITALSQEQLTATQTAGGPDLVKQVPNLTFSKTNFTGYNIQIRGIGTQAISVTTDPAVAVAFNDAPFIRNHFFEQEFFDVSQVEVLRGPQGTLYGRNATAGVVNVTSAKPTDQFEAMASADLGNYHNRRFEGMINLPIVDDRLDLRIAGEWTKRDGYSINDLNGNSIDGRNLWSGRVTLGWRPTEKLQAYLIWEHFQENDDRLRSAKQLCKTDPTPTEIQGVPIVGNSSTTNALTGGPAVFSQGCAPASLYSSDSFQVPNGDSLSYVEALRTVGARFANVNPYTSAIQSPNLRHIESTLDPTYGSKNNLVELNVDYLPTSTLTLTSQTAFNQDFLYSTEDYNRYNTTTDALISHPPDTVVVPDGNWRCADGRLVIGANICNSVDPGDHPTGVFCDPQLGCTSRLVGEDLSKEHAWQLNQEVRIASHFAAPVNLNAGANYLHYETAEDYYVFINALSLYSTLPGIPVYDFQCNGATGCTGTHPYSPGVSDNSNCSLRGFEYPDLSKQQGALYNCIYMDPNPIADVNGKGHNYFRSFNPYTLNSYAVFGEVQYRLSQELKLTAGLRWTLDRKHFTDIPSEVLVPGWGYPSIGVVNQEWRKATGRFVATWTPKIEFTDQTLVYGSFARGYKAGGANPPGATLLCFACSPDAPINPVHPLTFEPEYINAYEVGSKNSFFDGALTLNGTAFFYDYMGYQISEIVDRTSVNLNFDATVKGGELETVYEPLPGLKFSLAGGYEKTRMADGSKAVDLMDRTAGRAGWFVKKPFVTAASNCVLPVSTLSQSDYGTQAPDCSVYQTDPGIFAAPNNGAGFDKDLSGNELPNAPRFTVSLSGDYTIPLTSNWAGTLHADYYWQDYSWARVFNDNPYDRLRGYTNVNLAFILTSQAGWQVMGYVKNIFDVTDITGAFLNSDDSGLTTNVFMTDPRLFGVRITKNW